MNVSAPSATRSFASRELPKPLMAEELVAAEREVRDTARRPDKRRAWSTDAEHAADADNADDSEPLHILVVEDNPINQRLTCALLQKLGHRSSLAQHGQEALDMLETSCFDMVLMDVQMPVMDGIEATRQWRIRETIEGRPAMPIIAMTANAMAGDRDACLEAGMNGYVSKPVNMSTLDAEIDRLRQSG